MTEEALWCTQKLVFNNLFYRIYPGVCAVEREVEKKVDFARLAAILQTLPERERLLVSLKYGAEFNNREIARQTGLSESNVGTILFRAVQKLRQEWEK